MSDHALPKPVADAGDRIVDLVLDSIDLEDVPLKRRLYAAIQAKEHRAIQELHRVVVYFPTVDRISYEVPLIRMAGYLPRRLS